MTVILAILTLIVLITLDFIKQSRVREGKTVITPKLRSLHGTTVIERYYHPGHCWLLVQEKEPVVVGVDDFSQRLIGELDAIDLPEEGNIVRQGEPFITLRRGARVLTQVAPVSGRIERINDTLSSHPSRVNASPYERGWIAKITPSNLSTELHNLMKGSIAERWQEAVRIQLFRWFTPALGTVLQDGGTFIDNIGDLLTDDEWQSVLHEFYPTTYENEHQEGAKL